MIGIMDDSTEDIPDYMMRTSPERYYKSLEFLESLSKQIFAVKMEEVLAPVSYTHLDVYKRQVYSVTIWQER